MKQLDCCSVFRRKKNEKLRSYGLYSKAEYDRNWDDAQDVLLLRETTEIFTI